MNDERGDFKTFYERHQAFVRQILFRLIGANGIDDAVQDCFFKIWKSRDSFRGDANPRTWIYRIAVNLATDLSRAKPAHEALDDAAFNDRAATPDRDYASEVAIQDSVLALPPEYRSVVVAMIFNEMTIEEVSRALDIPAGTVKSRLSRGRALLREDLVGKGFTRE